MGTFLMSPQGDIFMESRHAALRGLSPAPISANLGAWT